MIVVCTEPKGAHYSIFLEHTPSWHVPKRTFTYNNQLRPISPQAPGINSLGYKYCYKTVSPPLNMTFVAIICLNLRPQLQTLRL
jgi:hypothetical protein